MLCRAVKDKKSDSTTKFMAEIFGKNSVPTSISEIQEILDTLVTLGRVQKALEIIDKHENCLP